MLYVAVITLDLLIELYQFLIVYADIVLVGLESFLGVVVYPLVSIDVLLEVLRDE